MQQLFALHSIVFGIGFVLVFDRLHRNKYINRFCNENLLSGSEIDQMRRIAMACQ
jgi:hypothetical protein